MTAVPILEPLRAEPRRAALLFDVDGTLAPIVDDPASASVPAPTAEVLARARGPLPTRRLRHRAPRRSTPARWSGSTSSPTPATTASSCCARARSARASTPGSPTVPGRSRGSSQASIASGSRERGLRLEDKGPIQALHWRGAPPSPGRPSELAAEIAAAAEEAGLVPHRGRKVLELRPLGERRQGGRDSAPGRRLGRDGGDVRRRRPHRPRRVRGPARAACGGGAEGRGLRRDRLGRGSAGARPRGRRSWSPARPAFLDVLCGAL